MTRGTPIDEQESRVRSDPSLAQNEDNEIWCVGQDRVDVIELELTEWADRQVNGCQAASRPEER